MLWTKQLLIDFEKRVADAFLAKQIHAPIHLSGGNEDQLIEIFKEVRPQDWVFSTWRSHYHALLKGIPEEWVWSEIMAGRSMYLNNKEHRFLSSAIVGGTLPIACGVVMGIRRRADEALVRLKKQLGHEYAQVTAPEKVWVFVGDMTARTGLFLEFCQYAFGHQLPVKVVIEDNGYSTNTRTDEAWGSSRRHLGRWHTLIHADYHYKRTYSHVGVGQHVQF